MTDPDQNFNAYTNTLDPDQNYDIYAKMEDPDQSSQFGHDQKHNICLLLTLAASPSVLQMHFEDPARSDKFIQIVVLFCLQSHGKKVPFITTGLKLMQTQ